jgi:hypothetical protein
MSRLATRVARLENHLRMGEASTSVVCWIGPDGIPEDLPEHLDGSVRVIYLPRKSASPEAWMHECALRRQQRPEEDPPHVPSL